MDGGAPYNPRTVEEVFRDFKGRRAGLIKALTTGDNFSSFSFLNCFALFVLLVFLPLNFITLRVLIISISFLLISLDFYLFCLFWLQMLKSSTSNVILV